MSDGSYDSNPNTQMYSGFSMALSLIFLPLLSSIPTEFFDFEFLRMFTTDATLSAHLTILTPGRELSLAFW
jgi:phosphoribulokinase